MDVLELTQTPVCILINGVDLISLVKTYETPLANAENHPQIAGAYQHLPPYELLDNLSHAARSNRAVLGCECGITECWAFTLRVKKELKAVVWTQFKQPHGPKWDYSALGEFRFSKENYNVQIRLLQEYATQAEAERELLRRRKSTPE